MNLARKTSKLQFDLCNWMFWTHTSILQYNLTWNNLYYAIKQTKFNASKMKQIRRWRFEILFAQNFKSFKFMNLIVITKLFSFNKQHHTRVIEYFFIITHHFSIFSIFVQLCFFLFDYSNLVRMNENYAIL